MPKALYIDKKVLKNLYLKEKQSSYEIAKNLNCSSSAIRNRLWALGISRSVQEAKSLMQPLHNRTDFDGRAEEMAYLIGFRLGDLHVSKTHPNSPTIRISCNTTKNEQLSLIRSLFSKYGYVKEYNRDKQGAISIRCFVNNSFSFLIKKEDKIEDWIMEKDDFFISFLSGYIDAEATFCICGGDGILSIKTQDKNILFAIWKKLNSMGILCKNPNMFRLAGSVDYRGVKNNKDAYIFTIYRKDSLLLIIKLLRKYLKHGKRVHDMNIVEKNINDRNLHYNFKKDNRWSKTYKT